MPDDEPEETLEQAEARIMVRYAAMERNSKRMIKGTVPSLIVSGPPGLGKSHTFRRDLKASGRIEWMDVQEELTYAGDDQEKAAPYKNKLYDVISGSMTPPGLYQALWNMRNGGIIMVDDCDSVFHDETCLNLLKAALDSDPAHRKVSWRKEAKWLEDYGIPKTFHFGGHVIFLTNIDFESVIAKNPESQMANHLRALIDRSLYLCLTLRSQRDFLIRIRQVAAGENGMLAVEHGLTPEQADEVLEFVEEHKARFYNLSLRLVGQIAILMKDDDGSGDWREDVIATKTKTR